MKKNKIILILIVMTLLFFKQGNLNVNFSSTNSEDKLRIISKKKYPAISHKFLTFKEQVIVKHLAKRRIVYYFCMYFNLLLIAIFINVLHSKMSEKNITFNYKKLYLYKDDF